eukprot:PhF_6_TR41995/c0_g1_i1/m.63510/K03020/RPC19, POLR1D; DNA-directed RNA polymerases I and III subunit RPAC2
MLSGRDICYSFQQQLKASQDDDVLVDSGTNAKISIDVLDDNTTVYLFHNEDHTLGNALRHTLMSNPQVLAAGYVIPHPLEPMMKMQVQVRPNEGLYGPQIVAEGLEVLARGCDAALDAFEAAMQKYQSKQDSRRRMVV